MSRRQSQVERIVELSKQLWYEFVDTPQDPWSTGRHGAKSCDIHDIQTAAEALKQVGQSLKAQMHFVGSYPYELQMQYLFRSFLFERFLTEKGIAFKVLDRDHDTQSEFEGIAHYDIDDEAYSNDFYVMDAASYAVLAGTHKFSDFRNVTETSVDRFLWKIIGMDGYLTIEKIMQLIPNLSSKDVRFLDFLKWRLENGI